MKIETLQQRSSSVSIENIPFGLRPGDITEILERLLEFSLCPVIARTLLCLYCVVRVAIVSKFLVRAVENCKREGRECNEALRGEISPIKLLPSCQR